MMTGMYALIWLMTLAAGGLVAWFYDFSWVQTLMALGVAGFIGSCAVALLFTFMFFVRRETPAEKIHRLQQEILLARQRKPVRRIGP
jgi:Co/Zn/Cd efflux system component